jgi:hypothetical protein
MTIPSRENEIGTLAVNYSPAAKPQNNWYYILLNLVTGRVATHVRTYNQRLAEYFAISRRAPAANAA